jgi:hypothetical protein
MNALDFSKPLNAALPRQQTTLEQKLKKKDKFGISDWMKDCMDSLEAIGRWQFFVNLDLKVNYGVVNKQFNLADYYDVGDYYDITSAISQQFNVPYHLKHYDITGKAVNLLVGEYLKRPDVFTVRAADEDATNERLRIKQDLLHTYISQKINGEITNKLMAQGIDPNKDEFQNEEEAAEYQSFIESKYKELTPQSIEKYLKYDFKDAAEHWATAVISNDRQRFNFRELEKVEFSDSLIVDRCFSHFYLTPTGYNTEYWNPLNTFFHQAPEVRYAEEGDYVGRTFYLSKTQVIDRFGWRMSKEQIELLYPQDNEGKQGNVFGEFFNATMFPFPAYRDYSNVTNSLGFDPWNNTPVGTLPSLMSSDYDSSFPNYQFATGDIVQVTEAYWKSQRRIGQVALQNPDTGESETMIVDDTFDPKLFGVKELKYTSFQDVEDGQEPNTIVWTWVPHTWQGLKINANFAQSVEDRDRNAIYADVKPCPFQFKGDFTPFNPKLPVVGGIFNNRNGKSNALVDLIKPYQIGYNAFMNLAYGIAQRNNGKVALINLRLLSNFKDWGGEEALEKALIIGRELGVLGIDDSPANTSGGGTFNQQTVLDMDESEKVERLMRLAIVWEEQGFRQIGITPQRQGQTQASETATGVTQAINNSYAITEPYFENFYNYKRRKLKHLLDIAQYCDSKKKDITLTYTTSDLGEAFLAINGTELMLRDIGVNVNNSQETLQELELARKLAVENNTTGLPMSALIKIIGLKSVADITKSLEEAEAEAGKQVQEQREHEKQIAEMQLQAQAEEKDKDRELKKYEIDTKANTELQKVTLQGIANESSFDPNADLTDKLIAQKDLAIKERQVDSQNYLAQQQLVNQQLSEFQKNKFEKEKQKAEKELKLSEAKSKKEIESAKLNQIIVQNKSQEKINKEANDAKLKLADKQIEIKQLEKKMKEMEIANAKSKSNVEISHLKKKIELEAEMGEAKADSIKKITEVKKKEAEKLSDIKVEETKQTSNINLNLKKKLAKQKEKDAKKPKK